MRGAVTGSAKSRNRVETPQPSAQFILVAHHRPFEDIFGLERARCPAPPVKIRLGGMVQGLDRLRTLIRPALRVRAQ